MKRFAVVLGLLMLAGACDKPTEENCRKALANVRALLGTESPESDLAGDIRRCKGGSSKKTVECAMNATSHEQLKACGFFKTPPKKDGDTGAASGSAAPAPAGTAPAAPAPAPAGTAPAAPAGTEPAAPAGAAPAAPAGAAPAGAAPAGTAPAAPTGAAPAATPGGGAPAAPAGAPAPAGSAS